MLKYSGDSDGVVPTYGTQMWIKNSLQWPITSPWRSYMVNGQVAGYIEVHEGNFTFATVHAAGHMAPQWKRPQMFYLINNWISGQPI
jgi:serine carboxypeptidase-like clade 2